MEKRKTDESVKAGLQIEADNKPLRKRRKRIPLAGNSANMEEPKEIDVDDVVHEPDFEPTAVFNKENSEAPGENEEKDPDDQVHGK
jgi:hypothetical protein